EVSACRRVGALGSWLACRTSAARRSAVRQRMQRLIQHFFCVTLWRVFSRRPPVQETIVVSPRDRKQPSPLVFDRSGVSPLPRSSAFRFTSFTQRGGEYAEVEIEQVWRGDCGFERVETTVEQAHHVFHPAAQTRVLKVDARDVKTRAREAKIVGFGIAVDDR